MQQSAQTTVPRREARCGHDAVVVTLSVPAEFGCRSAQLIGDFTAWAPVAMGGNPAGSFSLTVCLPRGRSWHYQFLVDGHQWMNDPNADDYAHNADGRAVSVLLT
jgi:hypothetical protein